MADEPPSVCICPRFSDTGGFRIADLTCPVHGVNGTAPGDGYWEADVCPGCGAASTFVRGAWEVVHEDDCEWFHGPDPLEATDD